MYLPVVQFLDTALTVLISHFFFSLNFLPSLFLSPLSPPLASFQKALMEFGATVCSPRDPSCTLCPLEDLCLSRQLVGQNICQDLTESLCVVCGWKKFRMICRVSYFVGKMTDLSNRVVITWVAANVLSSLLPSLGNQFKWLTAALGFVRSIRFQLSFPDGPTLLQGWPDLSRFCFPEHGSLCGRGFQGFPLQQGSHSSMLV